MANHGACGRWTAIPVSVRQGRAVRIANDALPALGWRPWRSPLVSSIRQALACMLGAVYDESHREKSIAAGMGHETGAAAAHPVACKLPDPPSTGHLFGRRAPAELLPRGRRATAQPALRVDASTPARASLGRHAPLRAYRAQARPHRGGRK